MNSQKREIVEIIINTFIVSIFTIGLIFMILNITGLFIPLKNPEIYQETSTGFEKDTTLTPQETLSLLKNLDKNDSRKFVSDTNTILNRSIAHYWDDEDVYKYNITIPWSENWILASLRYLMPSIYKHYQYCNYKKTIERGIGLCSQHAIAFVDFVNKNNIEARIIGLDGHVIATANINGHWWIFDPDFGLIIPHDIHTIEKNPAMIKDYYSEKFLEYRWNDLTLDNLVDIYGKEGNILYPPQLNFIGGVGYIDCNWKKVMIERLAYLLKWLIPLILITPLLYKYVRKS